MFLSNWRIGFRLTSGFSILIIMLFIVSFFSLSRLSDFQVNARNIVTDIYPRTQDSNALIDIVNANFISYSQMILANTQQSQQYINEITKRRADMGELLDKIEKYSNDESARKYIESIRHIRANFFISGEKIINLVQTGNHDDAAREFNNNLSKIHIQYVDTVKGLVDYQDNAMETSINNMAQAYNSARIILLIILALATTVGAVIAYLLTRSVIQPMQSALQLADNVAKGDLTSQIKATTTDETGLLLKSLNNMNSSLSAIVGQVRDGADTISIAATQIAAGNQDLSARTEEQASSLEETASSMEQLTATIKNTAENTLQAARIANQAAQAAQKSGQVMVSVTQKMRGIRDSSQRMAEIINVIDGISFQTNILALNAAVEAARAGEQGRGFAVVAGEVRSLAQSSATAAREIKNLIDDSVHKVQEGMSLVNSAEETLEGLTGYVRDVNDVISEISQASREQSEGIHQINIAVGQIDTTTQQNAALVEESAAAAFSLQAQAASLAESVSAFKLLAETRQHQPQSAL